MTSDTRSAGALSGEGTAPERWLSILGLGEDGVESLSPLARRLLASAEVVWGGRRHLELAGPLIRNPRPWPSPLEDAVLEILGMRGHSVCVLASGDPFLWGIGATLIRHLDPAEILCLPAPSAFSLAAARLGWPLQDTACLSLHGRPLERVVPYLFPGARILALSWDGTTPGKLASLLTARGMGRSQITVLGSMGGPREGVRVGLARDGFALVDPLNTVAIEVVAEPGTWAIPLTPGLPDAVFESDGQLTKREARAVTLSALAPLPSQLLWDVGAGSGSIAIEWMLRHPACRAIAIEERQDRAERIVRNALALGVPELTLVQGSAPNALVGLPAPDAVFVGGGAGDPGVLDACWDALTPGGRLVVNAVSIETESILSDRFRRFGGELRRISVARAEGVGTMHGWRTAMPVTQWALAKGSGS
ncbi:MAG: precorrin-6y C5,15-methyltransferase (decarboxylating) subunit CbiE [Rhodospirillales bacterium]|nr:precorrin-6y C5,15-methyltransferase (decarboxylating) subunit CbiE [Rhodospirillales bacterium]